MSWELRINHGRLNLNDRCLPLLAWGYMQYRLCSNYRIAHGGGGSGMGTPLERLVTTGSFAYSRTPMHMGHIIFLLGLTLSLQSGLGATITIATAVWFQPRVRPDEKRLADRFGQEYLDYCARARRWVPGMS